MVHIIPSPLSAYINNDIMILHGNTMTKAQTFTNVWDALEDSPEQAAMMTMRSNVMIAINKKVRGWNATQAQAARRLGITQPRLNDLLRGKINKF
ncbi:MAG TPA: XRE family transcriptional regulator, partial [Steroidobacteraceae bacterium]|nr:XRE family transcriptional regulator [Steroidobacteraceae bacterium]